MQASTDSVTQPRRHFVQTLLGAGAWVAGSGSQAGSRQGAISIAVAANFAHTLSAINQAFTKQTGITTQITAGSSGKFFSQIRQGAPFDVLLSADTLIPQQLIDAGLADAQWRVRYALGQLMLWSRDPARLPASEQGLRQWIAQPNARRLAIADPAVAPYGAAAVQTLQQLGLADWKGRVVIGQSIAQAFQFVATGNAPWGMIAASQLKAFLKDNRDSVWKVPGQLHRPIEQQAILIQSGRNHAQQESAKTFVRYLVSDAARSVIAEHGYGLVANDQIWVSGRAR